jgi:hypothetical protein
MLEHDDKQDHAEEDRPPDTPVAGRPFRFHLPAMRQITQRRRSADHGGDRLLVSQLSDIGRGPVYQTVQEEQETDKQERPCAYRNNEQHLHSPGFGISSIIERRLSSAANFLALRANDAASPDHYPKNHHGDDRRDASPYDSIDEAHLPPRQQQSNQQVWLTLHHAAHWAWWACHARHCCSAGDGIGTGGSGRPALASTKHFTMAAFVGWLVHIAVTSAAITPVGIIAAAAAISALIVGSPGLRRERFPTSTRNCRASAPCSNTGRTTVKVRQIVTGCNLY